MVVIANGMFMSMFVLMNMGVVMLVLVRMLMMVMVVVFMIMPGICTVMADVVNVAFVG